MSRENSPQLINVLLRCECDLVRRQRINNSVVFKEFGCSVDAKAFAAIESQQIVTGDPRGLLDE